MLFEYNDGDVNTSNVCFQGKLVSILNENKNLVDIKWKEGFLSDSDQQTSRETFFLTNYNPQKKMKGAWRQDLYKLFSTDL